MSYKLIRKGIFVSALLAIFAFSGTALAGPKKGGKKKDVTATCEIENGAFVSEEKQAKKAAKKKTKNGEGEECEDGAFPQ